MQRKVLPALLALFTALAAGRLHAAAPQAAAAVRPVDYTRDIKPILSNHCYACHGPDVRKARLRLDLPEEAVKKAITPGSAADSPLIERVASTDPDEVMPPPRAK